MARSAFPEPASLMKGDHSGFDQVLDSLFEGVYFVDVDRRIQRWNAGATSLTGFHAEELLHRHCADNILLHVDERGTQLCKSGCPLQKTLEDAQPRQATLFLRHKHGYRVPVHVRTVAIKDDEGKVVGAVETFREVNEAERWKARILELEKVAFIDVVTGIPNRRFLEVQLARLFDQLSAVAEPFTFCMLDVDHFKSANDLYGHEFGDQVLRSIGQTLLCCLRGTDMLGRWGGDEFVLLLPNTDKERAQQIMERSRILIAETATPVAELAVRMTVSIGAAVVSAENDRADLIQRVDRQLYLAKGRGRNCWSVA